jgi:hypothetical protein
MPRVGRIDSRRIDSDGELFRGDVVPGACDPVGRQAGRAQSKPECDDGRDHRGCGCNSRHREPIRDGEHRTCGSRHWCCGGFHCSRMEATPRPAPPASPHIPVRRVTSTSYGGFENRWRCSRVAFHMRDRTQRVKPHDVGVAGTMVRWCLRCDHARALLAVHAFGADCGCEENLERCVWNEESGSIALTAQASAITQASACRRYQRDTPDSTTLATPREIARGRPSAPDTATLMAYSPGGRPRNSNCAVFGA